MKKQEAIDLINDCVKRGMLAGLPLDARSIEALYFCLGVITQIDETPADNQLAAAEKTEV